MLGNKKLSFEEMPVNEFLAEWIISLKGTL